MSKNYQIYFSATCKIRDLKKMFVLKCKVITITLLLDVKSVIQKMNQACFYMGILSIGFKVSNTAKKLKPGYMITPCSVFI